MGVSFGRRLEWKQTGANYMKRRTLRQLRAKLSPEHHNVYVVLLKPAWANSEKCEPRIRGVIRRSRAFTWYDGIEARGTFLKSQSRNQSCDRCCSQWNPPVAGVLRALEPDAVRGGGPDGGDLADDLRRAGYTVTGGH